MGNVFLKLVGGSLFLIATSGSTFVLLNEHSPWVQALEAAGLLLWAGISIFILAAAGVLKLGAMVQVRARRRKSYDVRLDRP